MIKNNLKSIRMQEYMQNKREFAKTIGIAEQQYLRYENALTHPSLEISLKISYKLNKTVNEIWYIENDKND